MNLRTALRASVTITVITATQVSADNMATGEQIQSLLSGNTLQGSTQSTHFAEYYDPDGTLRGDGYAGQWKVEGDQGCMDYGEGFSCWSGYINGAAAIWFMEGKPDAAGMMIPGNPNDF